MNKKYGKEELIREIADRAHFTIGDVRIIWDTFEDIVYEVIKEKAVLFVGGLFKISVTDIAEHKGYDAYRKIPQVIRPTHRIRIRASKALSQLLK
jgi:nucleoid DNA-binding protein